MTSPGPGPATESDVTLLLTAWHLRRMRSMPRLFWRLRRLERDCRSRDGCLWVHRWISRRSLMLSSQWASTAAAEAWIGSQPFREFDAAARALSRTGVRLERYRPA